MRQCDAHILCLPNFDSDRYLQNFQLGGNQSAPMVLWSCVYLMIPCMRVPRFEHWDTFTKRVRKNGLWL
jgi:hypothetical protein